MTRWHAHGHRSFGLNWPGPSAAFTRCTVLAPLPAIFAALRTLCPALSSFTTSLCFSSSSAVSSPVPSGLPSFTPLRLASASPLLIRSRNVSLHVSQKLLPRHALLVLVVGDAQLGILVRLRGDEEGKQLLGIHRVFAVIGARAAREPAIALSGRIFRHGHRPARAQAIVSDKQVHLQYLDLEAAKRHCARGLGIWDWASTDDGKEPDVMLAYQLVKELGKRWAQLDMQVREGLARLNTYPSSGSGLSHPSAAAPKSRCGVPGHRRRNDPARGWKVWYWLYEQQFTGRDNSGAVTDRAQQCDIPSVPSNPVSFVSMVAMRFSVSVACASQKPDKIDEAKTNEAKTPTYSAVHCYDGRRRPQRGGGFPASA